MKIFSFMTLLLLAVAAGIAPGIMLGKNYDAEDRKQDAIDNYLNNNIQTGVTLYVAGKQVKTTQQVDDLNAAIGEFLNRYPKRAAEDLSKFFEAFQPSVEEREARKTLRLPDRKYTFSNISKNLVEQYKRYSRPMASESYGTSEGWPPEGGHCLYKIAMEHYQERVAITTALEPVLLKLELTLKEMARIRVINPITKSEEVY